MAKYGLQPNGMVILDDGRVWNPNDPLPPESVPAFNSTPMGSPLNGLGTMAPTAVAPSPIPGGPRGYAPMTASPDVPNPRSPTMAPKGMMFAGLPKSDTFAGISTGPDGQITQPLYDMPMGNVPAPAPKFFGDGGVGRSILGGLADGMLGIAGRPAVYAPAMEKRRQQEYETNRLGLQQMAEYQRQMALEAYKRAHPEAGSIEKNYNFLSGLDPSLGTSYAHAEANPMTLATNPATGAAQFVPKGGYSAMPISKTVNGQTAYWVNGAWYDNPEGK